MSSRIDRIIAAVTERGIAVTRPESAADVLAGGRRALRAHTQSQAAQDAYVLWHAIKTRGRCRSCVNEAEELLGL